MLQWVNAKFKSSPFGALTQYQVLRYLTLILTGVLLAKFGIDKNIIGRYETFVMLGSLVSFFWVSGIIQKLLANYSKHDEAEQRALLLNVFTALQTIALLVCVLVMAPVFIKEVFGASIGLDSGIVLGVAMYVLITAPTFLAEYILLLQKQYRALTTYGLLLFVITLSAVAAVLSAYHSSSLSDTLLITTLIVTLTVISIGRYVYLITLLQKYATLQFNPAVLKRVVIQALPLAGSIAISGSSEYIDAFLVKHFMTDADFAVFRYGAKELPILLIVANSFSVSMLPTIASDIQNGLTTLKEKSARLMHIFFPISIALLFISPYAFKLVFSPAFEASAFIFNIYLLLAIPRLIFPQTIIIAQGHTRFILWSSLIEISINIACSIFLYQYFGLAGIAGGTFVAFVIDKLFLIAVNKQISGIPVSSYIPFRVFIIYTALLLGSFCAVSVLNGHF